MGFIEFITRGTKFYWRNGECFAPAALATAICMIDCMADPDLNKEGSGIRRAICSTYSDSISNSDCQAVMTAYAIMFLAFLPSVVISPTKIAYRLGCNYLKKCDQETPAADQGEAAVTIEVDSEVADAVEAIVRSEANTSQTR